MILTKQENIVLLATKIFEILATHQLTICTAESCTGGLISAFLTELPGSSSYFLGGIVSYSNELKIDLLGVREQTLEEFGAVSEACAIQMAEGALKETGADIAIAITGIAGPSGGSVEKPVGTVFIGTAHKKKTTIQKYHLKGDRSGIRMESVDLALQQVLKFCKEEYS